MDAGEQILSAKKHSQEAAREKLLAAESHVSIVRLIVLLFCSFIYHFVLDDFLKINLLATITMVLAFTFSAVMFFYKPYKKHSLLLTRIVSVSADGIFIALWIYATGGADSPFYLLWCFSIIAVAQRFSFKETMLVSILYAFTYYLMVWNDPFDNVEVADLVVRLTFIPITGILAAYFSRELGTQISDKLQIRGLLNDLNTQMQQKEEMEFQLKQVQFQLELKVEERTNDYRILNEQLKKILRQKEKIQHEQEKTLERLENSNKELESFAYITSHDLKAPLRGIATIADWLSHDYQHKLDAEGQQNLKLLKQRARKMNDLIEGILQYSRIGKANFQPNLIDSAKLIDEIIRMINPDKNISFLLSEQLPVIHINRTLLTQVFENLLENAVTHMGQKDGKIIIDVIRKENESVFFVMDTGPGIDARYHQKIFEMFQTLEEEKNPESTGLGLAIVKKIINSFGGRVWVESEPGKGSSFFFSLPNAMVKENERVQAN